MLERLRPALAFLLLVLGLGLMARAVFAQDPEQPRPPLPAERASPRDTVFGFLRAMNDVEQERVPDLEEARRRATTFLELESDDPAARRDSGWPLALRLHEALDLHGRLDPTDVPDAAAMAGGRYWSLNTLYGSIALVRTERGWLFSTETLARVDEIVAAYARNGVQRERVQTFGARVRKRFPSLAGHALFLQHWQWLGLVTLFLLAWITHRVVAYVIDVGLGGFLKRRGWFGASADAARAAARPVGFFAVAALFAVAGPALELPVTPVDVHKWLVVVGAKLFASLAGVLILYRLADVFAERMRVAAEATDSRLDDQLVPLARKSIKILVTVGGVLFILDNLEADIWSLLAGAGVAGLAVAFAAQDTIKNLFGSVTVFLDRPFQVGDSVVVAGVEGIIEEVGFRSTRVRTHYNSLVSVPNSKLVDGIIDNMGMRTYRRFRTKIGVRYDTPPERIEAFCHGVRQIVLANPHMRHDSFGIYLNDWGASSLDILVNVFFAVPDWNTEMRERQNFMLEVIRLARDLGVGFAFPTQTLEVESLPDRPGPRPRPVDVGEMAAIADGFAAGGERSRPAGTERFGPGRAAPAPSGAV